MILKIFIPMQNFYLKYFAENKPQGNHSLSFQSQNLSGIMSIKN